MFRAKIAVAAACLMMASVHAQQAPAPSRLDDIIKRGTLRVGMTGDYLPFTSLDKALPQARMLWTAELNAHRKGVQEALDATKLRKDKPACRVV